MARLVFQDLSDNNPQQVSFAGFDGVFLKLYPTSFATGWAWLVKQLAHAVAWQKTHGNFKINFYAADSTSTWAAAKAAAAALGIDLNTRAFAFDLREFGFSRSYVQAQVDAAHAAGQVKVGEYYREADTGDWHWKARYLSDPPAEPWLLWQDADNKPLDHSVTHDGVTLDDFVAVTTATAGDDMDQATFNEMLDVAVTSHGVLNGIVEGCQDANNGKPKDASKGIFYSRAYDLVKGGSTSGDFASTTHTHTTGKPSG